MYHVLMQTAGGTANLIPTSWAFSDLTGAIGSIAGLDLVKLPFFGLVGFSILLIIARRLKGTVKAGR